MRLTITAEVPLSADTGELIQQLVGNAASGEGITITTSSGYKTDVVLVNARLGGE